MTDALYSYVNTIAAYSLILTAFLIFKDRRRIRGVYPALSFIASVFTYLIIEYVDHWAFRTILIAGPSLIPFTFWLLSRTMFRDDEQPKNRLVIYLIATVIIYYSFYFIGQNPEWTKVAAIGGRVFSIFFIVMAIVEAQIGGKADLDESRRKLRRYFTYFIGITAIITMLSEISLNTNEQQVPRFVQRSAILIFNSIFIVYNFSFKSQLFDARKKLTEVKNPNIIEKIQSAMLDEELYRMEKLTIGQLAEKIGEQEYKVRSVINQEMGYRNFIDFTNSFRVKQASEVLKDGTKSNLTILEIAYESGFNSIGPFNRAFKATTGLTPTDFRKKNQSNTYSS